MMMSRFPSRPLRPRCPHNRLARMVAQHLPSEFQITSSGLRPWASASFVGARHHFLLDIAPQPEPAPPPDFFAAKLTAEWKDKEWPLVDHIVADLHVEPSENGGLRLEILTVEE
jgi:hypothetical protein